jgi:hypothetical protein
MEMRCCSFRKEVMSSGCAAWHERYDSLGLLNWIQIAPVLLGSLLRVLKKAKRMGTNVPNTNERM